MAVSICRPTDIDSNQWCLKNLYALGEGTDLIAIPTPIWNQTKSRWENTAAGTSENPLKVLVEKAGSPLVEYQYNAPTSTSILFPEGVETNSSLYLQGNALIFNPTVGNAIEANGVPYQTSTITIPIGSDMYYDMFAQFMQSKAWTFIKLNNDNQIMHVYGGPRGYFPTADEVAEMMYSGNNDAKGEASLSFTMEKAAYTVEYITLDPAAADKNALVELMTAIRTGICKPVVSPTV